MSDRRVVPFKEGEHVTLGTILEDRFEVGAVRVRVQIGFDDARGKGPPVFPVITPDECKAVARELDVFKEVLLEAATLGRCLGNDGGDWLMFEPESVVPAKEGAH